MQHENPFKTKFIHISLLLMFDFFGPFQNSMPLATRMTRLMRFPNAFSHYGAAPDAIALLFLPISFKTPKNWKIVIFQLCLQFVKIGLILKVLLRLFFAYKGGAVHGWIDQVLLQQEANGALIDFFSTSFFQYEDTLLCTLNYTHPPKHQEDFHSLKGAFKWLH